ncbi:MAG: guanylate kinase [Myxococcota bacterium]|nr:guanylate kinase [Myxococcota bacterium]
MGGSLFVFSAPSGAGKTTITRRMVAEHPQLLLSISTTTRPIRAGEVDGEHYNFVSEARFRADIAAGCFLEWAEVHGNLYGSDAGWVDSALASGRDIIFDIDVQGGHQIHAARPETVLVLIVPPSWEALESRLRGRGTDNETVIRARLAAAKAELQDSQDYDVVIVNDDLQTALDAVRAVLRREHAVNGGRAVLDTLVKTG